MRSAALILLLACMAATAQAEQFTAGVIATWVSEFWLGMEFSDLLEVKEERVQHRAALDAMQQLLEALDARVQKRPKRRRK